MQRRTACLAAGLLAAAGTGWSNPSTLRFAVGQSWAPPYVERVGNRIAGGLWPEVMGAIAAELGMGASYELLPPARVELALAKSTVDLHCGLSPSWWPELRGSPRWSPPLFALRDVLVAGPSGPTSLRAFEARRGWRVATVRRYVYPTLEADFRSGRLLREETQDQGLALGMVAKQRTELAVVNEFVLRAYVQRQPEVPLLALRVVDEVQAHCLLSEHPALPPARIQAAIRRMIDKGRLDEVLANYR